MAKKKQKKKTQLSTFLKKSIPKVALKVAENLRSKKKVNWDSIDPFNSPEAHREHDEKIRKELDRKTKHRKKPKKKWSRFTKKGVIGSGKPGPKLQYPLDRWFNGLEHTIHFGKDFKANLKTMINYLYKVARERKCKIKIVNALTIQAVLPRSKKSA